MAEKNYNFYKIYKNIFVYLGNFILYKYLVISFLLNFFNHTFLYFNFLKYNYLRKSKLKIQNFFFLHKKFKIKKISKSSF